MKTPAFQTTALASGFLALALASSQAQTINIGNRLELFADGFLIDSAATSTTLKLQKPVAREMVLELTKPWEGDNCAYMAMVKDGNKYRIFYRGNNIADVPAFPKDGNNQVTSLIESTDGINWTRPVLNKVSYNGSTANNIVRKSDSEQECHNFSVFRDENPNCPPNARYKAIGRNKIFWESDGSEKDIHLNSYISPDGINWTLLDDRLPYNGRLDSQNHAFWDPVENKYWIYYRDAVAGPRNTSVGWSPDFITWYDGGYVLDNNGNEAVTVIYPTTGTTFRTATANSVGWLDDSTANWTIDQFKKNYPTAVSVINLTTGEESRVPNEINKDGNYANRVFAPGLTVRQGDRYQIIQRTQVVKQLKYNTDTQPKSAMYASPTLKYFRAPHLFVAFPARFYGTNGGVADRTEGLFMMSRDGENFHRYLDDPIITFTDPSNRDGSRGTYAVRALEQLPGDVANNEMSMYATERYYSVSPDYRNLGVRIRRFTYRLDGFASVNAGATEAVMRTKTLSLTGARLVLNAKTTGTGYIKTELTNSAGTPLPGFSAAQSVAFTGDSISHTPTWTGNPSLTPYLNTGIRVRFVMKNADLYSMQFAEGGGVTKPTVTVSKADGQAATTSSLPINFKVEFSKAVTGFTDGDVTLGGTAPGSKSPVVTGSGTTYNVAVTGLTGSGTVTASIGADKVDGGNSASTGTDNSVQYNAPAVPILWDGGAGTGDWGASNNWDPNGAKFGNTADLVFYKTGTPTSTLSTFLGGANRSVRSINFDANADSAVRIGLDNNSGTARILKLESSTGTSRISVAAGAAGDITFESSIAAGGIMLSNPLEIDHNGSGTLRIKSIQETSAGHAVTKTGSGTLVISGGTTGQFHTGQTLIHGGRLLMNSPFGATGATIVGGAAASGTPTLGGTGTLRGNVTIKGAAGGAAGTLAPGGTSPGTLRFGSKTLTLESGAKLAYRLGTARDSVTGVSTLALGGQQWSDFTFTAGSGFGPGTYVLINAASVTGSLGTVRSGPIGANTGTLSVNSTADLVLTVAGSAKPTVTVSLASGQTASTDSLPINFKVEFSKAVTGFTDGDVTLGGTAPGADRKPTVTGSGTTYNVAVTGLTGSGTVTATIGADVVDGGNSASTGNPTVTYNMPSSDQSVWDGGSTENAGWGSAANWVGDTIPAFNTTTDIAFHASGASRLDSYLGIGRIMRSITFNSNVKAAVTIRQQDIAGTTNVTARPIYLESDTGTSTIRVESGASGRITFTGATGGQVRFLNDLIIDHHGSEILTIRALTDMNVSAAPFPTVTKTGSGLFQLAAASQIRGTTRIEGGTLRLGAANHGMRGPVSIGNATLDPTVYAVTAGTLTLTGTARIQLGTGAKVAFANSSAVNWGSGTLALTGTFVSGSSLRFGTTATGLTATQLAKISATGFTGFALDSTGFLIAAPASTALRKSVVSSDGDFISWQDANDTSGDVDEDHDGDGVPNGVEHFLGGGTDTSGPTALPGVALNDGVMSITWTMAADYQGAYGVNFHVETSDLPAGPWTAEAVSEGGNVSINGRDITYTFPAPLGTGKFVRLVVTEP